MKILKHRESGTYVRYYLLFNYLGSHDSSGFSFDCDSEGNVDKAKLLPRALQNYKECLTGSKWQWEDVQYDFSMTDPERKSRPIHCTGQWIEKKLVRSLEKVEIPFTEPAIGLCEHCGRQVSLSGFTNTCECDTDYNMSGQLLAPRSQWGEETGESLFDIMGIG